MKEQTQSDHIRLEVQHKNALKCHLATTADTLVIYDGNNEVHFYSMQRVYCPHQTISRWN